MATEEMLVKAAVEAWKTVNGRLDKGIGALDEEQMQQRVAPGRNRLQYLVGHLTAVHDRMFPLLRVGERVYAVLDEPYLVQPDGALPDPLPVEKLKQAWSEVNERLTAQIERFTAAEWLERHASVSEEDFAKDPSRNRLAVLLSRTNHASFHAGQMVLVKHGE